MLKQFQNYHYKFKLLFWFFSGIVLINHFVIFSLWKVPWRFFKILLLYHLVCYITWLDGTLGDFQTRPLSQIETIAKRIENYKAKWMKSLFILKKYILSYGDLRFIIWGKFLFLEVLQKLCFVHCLRLHFKLSQQ